jgi:iron(III) transport system substrate-binding protein
VNGNAEQPKKDRSWRDDEFARHEVSAQTWFVWGWILVAVMALLAWFLLRATSWLKSRSQAAVIVYAAQDQVYAEPILREFEKETGIKVKAVYDSEAVKTVGLANRLLAERSYPQCDVFWGNEEMRTVQLATLDVFRETNGWAAFGHRSRRIVINTNFVRFDLGGTRSTASHSASAKSGTEWNSSLPKAPRSLLELTNEIWRGKIALAFPQFGTTATHFHALRQLWGEEHWLAWCRALAANKPFIVDGNSVVVKLVARGEAWIGLTDSDDIAAGQREGLPIAALPLTDESLLIPNTVAVIRNAPRPANAQKLFEYLQRREVSEKLVQAKALESSDMRRRRGNEAQTETKSETPHVVSYEKKAVRTLEPDWEALLRDLEITTKQLNEIFLR